MDAGMDEKLRHFRGKPRPGRRVAVDYRVVHTQDEGAGVLVPAITRNLGAGGAFILCPDPLPVGTRLHLSLRLPTTARAVELDAEVRWLIAPGDDPAEAGMGVKFITPDVGSLLALSDYFASLTGADFHDHDPIEPGP